MTQASDHGGGQPDNVYCQHCTDAIGNLKPKEEVREGMILYSMQSTGKTREEAEKEVEAHMFQMPAWSGDKPSWEPVVTTTQPPIPDQPQTGSPWANAIDPSPMPTPQFSVESPLPGAESVAPEIPKTEIPPVPEVPVQPTPPPTPVLTPTEPPASLVEEALPMAESAEETQKLAGE